MMMKVLLVDQIGLLNIVLTLFILREKTADEIIQETERFGTHKINSYQVKASG